MRELGALGWFGALAGIAAPLTIGFYAWWGARHRPGYDAWRDDLTDLGDETDRVALLFPFVNALVGLELVAFALVVRGELPLPQVWIGVLIVAGGSVIIGLTPCERRCRRPWCSGTGPRWVRRAHVAAGATNILASIAIPIWAALIVRGDDDLWVLRWSWLLAPIELLLAVAFVVAHGRSSRAREQGQRRTAPSGLLERLVFWVVGYAWVVIASLSILRGGAFPLIGVAVWVALGLLVVTRLAARDPSPDFELADCQPNTLIGVRGTRVGLFMVRRIDDPAAFRTDLRRALEPAGERTLPLLHGTGTRARGEGTVTLALSARGLRKLDVAYRWHAPYVEDAFAAGMQARAQALGDLGLSDPLWWDDAWRDPDQLDVAMWIVAPDAETLDDTRRRVDGTFGDSTAVVVCQPTAQLGRSVEHFGFRDGIGAVWIERVNPWRAACPVGGGPPAQLPASAAERRGGGVLTRRGAVLTRRDRWRPIAVGEFVLGQRDETGDSFPVPSPGELFEGGTFMVVRKLEQDVPGFRRLTAGVADLGPALVGRRPDGTPLARPDAGEGQENDFTYGNDPEGRRCPRGSHIRRANPRDALGFLDTMSARRRLIRRGMPYGPPYRDGEAAPPPGGRGLLFIAYNARIAEQFEFVQSQWLNSGEGFGLGGDPDVVAGLWRAADRPTVVVDQPDAAPRVLTLERPLVRARGGEYFFVPSLRGLRYLAALTPPDPVPR